ncbi:MAG: symmetrical bis(5'-nucleosyl)-tetraphosphatase [Chromatiales bacterium]|jgi:bis(5'-nucleosyl)-tetraphosphatase (symmetrical)|nr:symmetrical bis(5'-nucleosyl)-tetraphosphatase [Chromatiales bacterium]MDX9767935.1 symmetrical bis(5'-nucleosyl)-tetraphosphatase [Ectothiorhodospiraceae bacterium]
MNRSFAIGDIQGYLDPLQRLLDRIGFDPAGDRLWLVGDLVNRGPQSLETLRFVKGLGEAATVVLGNHDLHLLAVAHGKQGKRKDTLEPILKAPDRDELLDWLRRQPLLHDDPTLDYTMVHAGLPPQWDMATARRCAREVETQLQADDFSAFLQRMYGDQPDRWDPALSGWDRLRFITNCFTRLRYCSADGRLDMEHKGPPGMQPLHLMPWYAVPGRASRERRIVFGHWSTAGLIDEHGVVGLDTGCIWGGRLSAVRLDTAQLHPVQVDCKAVRKPGTSAG